ncbi:hypothetical protein BB934_36265 (plasmid) [Microvirga ossetica]|uniref:DUF3616 domain-containing protein n=1 Tax=Microvirga ossetica TaxID=1882682 RepID=A0A1B2EUY4_9HYPH|nr:DUF3616 domain-containing protein [Microvirga ossetica]ANY83702.1 hypothetical protein BB934_36265 [Microvirga ossetica]
MPDTSATEAIGQIPLTFTDWRPLRHVEDPLHKDLSAVARIGDSLFVACDETASLERLRRLEDGSFGDHQHFVLDALVDLPASPAGEMDIEGLCEAEDFLWVVGSHARKRSKPKPDEADHSQALQNMVEIEREPNRYFLGRIPLVEAAGLFTPARSDGERQAAWLKLGKKQSALEHWLAADPHLGPFLKIPAKENGLDVEGLAVRGNRVWLGLRGPVLRGHAVVLDLELRSKASLRLKARRVDGERRYRKHLLDTRGLGIRDMRFEGDDLLLLVRPTMSLEGPAFVLRWRHAAHDNGSGVIAPERVETVAELPYRLHVDHPEGLDLWPEAGAGALLIIYDAPAPERTDPDTFTVRADVICPRRA